MSRQYSYFFIWVIRCACQEGHRHGWRKILAQQKEIISLQRAIFYSRLSFRLIAHPMHVHWFCLFTILKFQKFNAKFFTSFLGQTSGRSSQFVAHAATLVIFANFATSSDAQHSNRLCWPFLSFSTLVRVKLVPFLCVSPRASSAKQRVASVVAHQMERITEKLICFVVFNHFLKRKTNNLPRILVVFQCARNFWPFWNQYFLVNFQPCHYQNAKHGSTEIAAGHVHIPNLLWTGIDNRWRVLSGVASRWHPRIQGRTSARLMVGLYSCGEGPLWILWNHWKTHCNFSMLLPLATSTMR